MAPLPSVRARRVGARLGLLALVAALVTASLAVGGPSPSAASSSDADRAPAEASSGHGSPLSPRLQALSRPAVASLSLPGRAAALDVAATGPMSLLYDNEDRVLVTARVTATDPSTVDGVEAAGAVVTFVDPTQRSITMRVSPAALPALATVPGLEYVREELAPLRNATCPTGIMSEGDAQLKAATARATHGVDGSGVAVGIVSDSYDKLGGAPGDVAAGELPGTTNPCGMTTPVTVLQDGGPADEGRAMAQVVHDLAPGASLSFATAVGGDAAFAANITALRNAGVDVIVDDITSLTEPMYQDGVIAKAVSDAQAAGVTYFSSAGNQNVVVNGADVGSYEAPTYRPSTCPSSVAAYARDCHDFDPGLATDVTDSLTFNATSQLLVILGWNEPQYGISTDLNLFLLDDYGNIVAGSVDDNPSGSQAAFEGFGVVIGPGQYRLVIGRKSTIGTPRLKFVLLRPQNLTQVEWTPSGTSDTIGPTIFGHNAALAASTVAAVPYNDATTVEPYSSRGPATYCYGPVVGTTPAAPLPSCLTKQVDIAATDGVQNSFLGGPFPPYRFYGTSAAAPHAAAVAALQLEHAPCATPVEVVAAQASSGRPVGSFGPDARGAGLLDADVAVANTGPCTPTPGSLFHPLAAPKRILDSRPPPEQVGPYGTPWGAGTIREVTVAGGTTTVPAGATAVTLNVTVTGTTAPSFLTVWPEGATQPTASNLNWVAGQTIPNAVTVKVGADGKVNVFNPSGNANVIVDVVGYYDQSGNGAGLTSHAPKRILDSRPPPEQVGDYATPWGPQVDRLVQVAGGTTGVPTDAEAVVLNATVTGTTAESFLTVYPNGATRPTASSLNWKAGQTIPNAVTVKVGTDGKVRVYNNSGDANVIFDVVGYFKAGSGDAFHPVAPVRFQDSRPGAEQVGPYNTPWRTGTQRTVSVLTSGAVPSGAKAILANVTVTTTSAESFLTVWNTGATQPTASSLNWKAGVTIANAVTAKIGTGNTVSVFNNTGNVNVIADAAGWYG